jgi:hypothetical protein
VDLSGGWLKGLEQLRPGGAGATGDDGREPVRRILLLTDGLANVGITEPGAFVGLAEQAGRPNALCTPGSYKAR